MILGAISGWLNVWLTPLWLLGLGAVGAVAILLVLWGVLLCVSREGAKAVPAIITEGPMLPVAWVTLGFAAFGILGSFVIRDRVELFDSLKRLASTGSEVRTAMIPAGETADVAQPVKFPFQFQGEELKRIRVNTPENLEMTTPPNDSGEVDLLWTIDANSNFVWQGRTVSPISGKRVDGLYLTNVGQEDAEVSVTIETAPLHQEAFAVPTVAAGVALVFLLFLAIRWLFPKIAAIAHAAAKSEMAQPLYLVLSILGFCLIGVFLFIPYHTFGEDIKIFKDSGLTLIMVFCIFHAVWSASNSVSEEIDGKTALTVLSKPVGRRQFILGKFAGIAWTELALFVMLGSWFLIIVAYKPIYDGRESAAYDSTWQIAFLEMWRTIPGLILAFFETLVFVAISVAISTRLPMLANVSICFAIYALGHLTPLIVQSNLNSFEPVSFVGRLIATVLPVLAHFNIQAAIAAGVAVPFSYLVTAGIYCFIYCTIALLVALIMFEDRDLA